MGLRHDSTKVSFPSTQVVHCRQRLAHRARSPMHRDSVCRCECPTPMKLAACDVSVLYQSPSIDTVHGHGSALRMVWILTMDGLDPDGVARQDPHLDHDRCTAQP